jgi:hypothetical protein
MIVRRRGRPPRNGERASHRIEFAVTAAELDAIRGFAGSASIADTVRLLVLGEIADAADSELSPVTIPAMPDPEHEKPARVARR